MSVYRPKYRDPKKIDDFRFNHRFDRRAAVINWLLEAALKPKLPPTAGV
jgi:hypothetical protein